jgi:DNA replication and repair protein RecF
MVSAGFGLDVMIPPSDNCVYMGRDFIIVLAAGCDFIGEPDLSMHLVGISLEHYRNITLARLEFDPTRPTFFVGSNGQGKSNLLEALGLITAVRSFRTHELTPLIQRRQKLARVLFRVMAEGGEDEVQIELQLAARSRTIQVDDQPVERMADFVGCYPSVVFAADDTQLIKSGPQLRRRFFDLLFSVLDRDYLVILQGYHRALKERNQALAQRMDRQVILAYDRLLAGRGSKIVRKRMSWMDRYSQVFQQAYASISGDEGAGLSYKGAAEAADEAHFLDRLAATCDRDRVLGATSFGPHRDDYAFAVTELGARSFGSDGQQRSFVLALKLAQLEITEQVLGRKPLVLLDDILGELDDGRKSRFWKIFDHGCQVFASGTSLPTRSGDLRWKAFEVEAGSFRALQD